MTDQYKPELIADEDLEAVQGAEGIKPVRVMKRLDQTTPLAADENAGDTFTTCGCTHL